MGFGSKSFLIVGGVVVVMLLIGGVYFFSGGTPQPANINTGNTGQVSAGGTGVSWKNDNGTLTFVWQDLPSTTKLLNIYKDTNGSSKFLGSLPVPNGSQANGTAELNVGRKVSSTDTLSIDANSGEGPGNLAKNVLWKSPPPPASPPGSPPGTPPSPPGAPPSSPQASPPGTPPSPPTPPGTFPPPSPPGTPPPPPATPPGSPPTPPPSPPGTPPPSPPTPPGTPPPSPTPPPPASPPGTPPPPPPPPPSTIPSFQVSNSIHWIELTWQHLPSNTDLIVFSRANNPGGPWDVFYSEANPETTGPFTVKVTIDTPNVPFYYELTAYQGSNVIGVYGPVYLSALQQ